MRFSVFVVEIIAYTRYSLFLGIVISGANPFKCANLHSGSCSVAEKRGGAIMRVSAYRNMAMLREDAVRPTFGFGSTPKYNHFLRPDSL